MMFIFSTESSLISQFCFSTFGSSNLGIPLPGGNRNVSVKISKFNYSVFVLQHLTPLVPILERD